MKIKIIVGLIILSFISCTHTRNKNKSSLYKSTEVSKNKSSLYKITKITKNNNWYEIYSEKQDTLYKIISKVPQRNLKQCKKIRVGNYYPLEIKSRWELLAESHGTDLMPVSYLKIECFNYDESTKICIEIDKGIYKLYHSQNLKGLCLIH